MNFIDKMVERFIKLNRRMKRWQRIVSVMAAVVVFVTTYALVLPAITLDTDTASTQAGIDVAASENVPDEAGTVFESVEEEPAAEEEPVVEEEPEEAAAEENSSSESGSQEAEAAEVETVAENNADESGQTEVLTTEEAATYSTTEAAIAAVTGKTAEEVKLITEDTQLTFAGSDYIVYADFGASAKLPEGVQLKVKEITKESDPEAYNAYYEKALSEMQDKYDENTKLSFAKFYDIAFVYEGVEIEPSGNVNVRIEYKKAVEIEKNTTVDTIHFDKNDEKAEVISSDTEGTEKKVEAVEFKSDQFSVYGIVGAETIVIDYLTDEGTTYEIAVDLSSVTNVPNDAYLDIRELSGDEYDHYLSATADALGTDVDSITRTKLFDIAIKSGNNEIEPDGIVNVDIKLKKETFGDASVVHFGKETEVLDATTEGNVISFETESFSVYAIIPYDGIPQPPRVTFEFEDPNNPEFYFIDKAGNHQTTQIIKNSEVLQDVGLPTIPSGETFGGWFIYDGDAVVEAVNFETPIAVAYGEEGSGSSVSAGTVTIDPNDLDDDGTYHVRVKAFFGEVVYLTFYEDAAGTNILNRIQIAKGTTYDISAQTVNAPESELAFGGWNETAGENDDDREAIVNTSITFDSDDSFYPIFKSGHWLTFYTGATGSGADYRAPVFVIAGGTASGVQPANPTWKGYAFQYWTETNLYTGENGSYVQPSSAPARFNFNSTVSESKTLYAYWTPADTTYTVVFWQQSVNDNKNATNAQKTYTFAEQITEHGTSGTTVYASNYNGRYGGFNLNTSKSDTSIVVKADGTSIINIYFDRQLITLKFYRNGNNVQAPGYNNDYYNTTTGNNRVTVYTGLYGQTLAQNNYEWPNGEWSFYTTNATAGMSYLGQFVFPLTNTGGRVVRDTANQEMRLYYTGAGQSDIRYYIQDANNLNNYTLADTGRGSGGTFNFSEKFDGFEIYRYRRLNHNTTTVYQDWTNAAVGGTTPTSHTTGGGWSSQTVYEDLEIRYNRKTYNLKYLDSVDNTELAGITSQRVVYGATLSSYEPSSTFTPVSQYPGKVWDGKWYKDQACSEEFVWTDTMPNADMVVYAGWEDVYYKVDIDPNGGVLTEGESTFFWRTYGQTVQRYNDVTRDYVENPDGNYKYEDFLRSEYEAAGYDPWYYDGYLRTARYVTNDTVTTVQMNPSDSTHPSGTFTYPYDSLRYSYDKGAYALIGWYELTFADGHYGDLNYVTGESPYSFGTEITHDTYIQAKWRRVGEYHVEYKMDVYLMDADGNVDTSDSGIDTTNVPTDSYSYADQSQSSIMRAPDSPITVGEGDNAKQYVFQGWWYNGQLYTPGDVFSVLASLAEDKVIGHDDEHDADIIQKTVYIYPVYQAADDMPVDTTHIWWYSNWKDKNGDQISDLTFDTQLKDETSNELQPNEAIDIMPISDLIAESDDFDGYTFKGWARVPTNVDVTAETFNANTYMYLYWDGEDFHVDSETGTVVTEVAADENLPYHDMYAVWEINKYTVTVTKTVVGTDDDQHIGFTFAPEFTKYTGASNFILAGQETTVTDEDTGETFTYHTSKEFAEVPYGATLKLTENEEDDFDTTVKYTVTSNADGTEITDPVEVDSENGATYTIQGDITIAYTNARNTQSVKIVKTGDNTEGASIAGATFTLTDTDYGTLTSDDNGRVTAEDETELFILDIGGTYTLTETAPPQYFEGLTGTVSISATSAGITATPVDADADKVAVSQDDDGVYILTITNTRKTADVTVTKNVEGLDADKTIPFTFTTTGVSAESVTKELFGDTESTDHSVTYQSIAYGTSISIAETANEDFNTTYSVNGGEVAEGTTAALTVNEETVAEGTINVVFTNARNKQKLQVLKVNESTTALGKAEFSLYTEEEYNKGEEGTAMMTGLVSGDGTTIPLGEIEIGNVATGKYYLVETKAPDGYLVLTNPVVITIESGRVYATLGTDSSAANVAELVTPESGDPYWEITVHNSAGEALPYTGGPGTLLYTLSGLMLILASALMYGFRMRRGERRFK